MYENIAILTMTNYGWLDEKVLFMYYLNNNVKQEWGTETRLNFNETSSNWSFKSVLRTFHLSLET